MKRSAARGFADWTEARAAVQGRTDCGFADWTEARPLRPLRGLARHLHIPVRQAAVQRRTDCGFADWTEARAAVQGRTDCGFTLIELIAFIVIVAILGVALLTAFSTGLRGSPEAALITQAAQLAQERMELILAQRRAAGFTAFADPCVPGPGPSACTPPSGYSVNASIAPNWNGDSNYRVVTVTVTGPSSASAVALVANY